METRARHSLQYHSFFPFEGSAAFPHDRLGVELYWTDYLIKSDRYKQEKFAWKLTKEFSPPTFSSLLFLFSDIASFYGPALNRSLVYCRLIRGLWIAGQGFFVLFPILYVAIVTMGRVRYGERHRNFADVSYTVQRNLLQIFWQGYFHSIFLRDRCTGADYDLTIWNWKKKKSSRIWKFSSKNKTKGGEKKYDMIYGLWFSLWTGKPMVATCGSLSSETKT